MVVIDNQSSVPLIIVSRSEGLIVGLLRLVLGLREQRLDLFPQVGEPFDLKVSRRPEANGEPGGQKDDNDDEILAAAHC